MSIKKKWIKGCFKSFLNLEHSFERKKMFNRKRSLTLSATLLALIMGASVFLGSPAVAEEPQYGGTLTWISLRAGDQPKSWDSVHITGYWWGQGWQTPYSTTLLKGDVEKYGPRGTGEFDFMSHFYIPDQYIFGDLAESWEITEDKHVFRLRKGAMWLGNDLIGMEPREITADDVVFHFNRSRDGAQGKANLKQVRDVYAEDRYTVVFDLKNFSADWPQWIGYGPGANIIPPEVVEAGPDNWRHQVSSGPFILKDYLPGSVITYEKNPDHWWTTTIDGKVYDDIPFINKLVHPLIPDAAARLAALRTGKADGMEYMPFKDKETLPDDLSFRPWIPSGSLNVAFNNQRGKWKDRNVRRAMNIGTDREALGTAVHGEGSGYTIHTVFGFGTPIITPIEEMPEETRMLFEYNPELAKKMLADAGYPDGFDMELVIRGAGGVSEYENHGSVLASQWAKIGVNVNLKVLEAVAHAAIRGTSHDYDDGFMFDTSHAPPEMPRMMSDGEYPADFDDPHYDELVTRAMKIAAPAERDALLKEAALYFVNEASWLPTPASTTFSGWWPWLKNYYGEIEAGYTDTTPMHATLWIDQGLKKQMGY